MRPEDQACQDLAVQAVETASAQFPETGVSASSRAERNPMGLENHDLWGRVGGTGAD